MNHHEINNLTKESINKKKHEAAKRKFAPKTKARRLKSTFYILTGVWIVAQVCSASLASTGIIHYASTRFNNNGFAIVIFAVFILGCLEFAFNRFNKDLHSQIHDDKEGVNPITCVLIAVFGVFYIGSTYWGTPYAVEYFAASPSYHDIEATTIKHDIKIKKDTLVCNSFIASASSIADGFLQSHGKTDSKSGRWRIRSDFAKRHADKVARVDSLSMKKDVVFAKLVALKDADLKEKKAENKVMQSDHIAWCSTFGQNLSILSIFFVLAFLLSFGWCQWFERFEHEENESILSQEQELPKEKETVKKKKKKKNQTPTNIKKEASGMQVAFASSKEKEKNNSKNQEKKEGYFCKENQTVLVRMTKGPNKGKLVAKDKTGIKNAIGNGSPGRRTDYFKELLKNFA